MGMPGGIHVRCLKMGDPWGSSPIFRWFQVQIRSMDGFFIPVSPNHGKPWLNSNALSLPQAIGRSLKDHTPREEIRIVLQGHERMGQLMGKYDICRDIISHYCCD